MSIDQTKHSLFGASKAAADLLVQEYGRYFGMPTVSLRGGCLTGPAHAGTELHGFLSYLMICAVSGKRYRVFPWRMSDRPGPCRHGIARFPCLPDALHRDRHALSRVRLQRQTGA
jgi:hypothetical protein